MEPAQRADTMAATSDSARIDCVRVPDERDDDDEEEEDEIEEEEEEVILRDDIDNARCCLVGGMLEAVAILGAARGWCRAAARVILADDSLPDAHSGGDGWGERVIYPPRSVCVR